MLTDAHKGSAQVLYAANQTTVEAIISVAKEVLLDEDMISCWHSKPGAQFNVYKNCFRELTLILHNKLMFKIGLHLVVTTGTVDHCFTIVVINESDREEYFFTIGDIYFEVFKYKNQFIAKEEQKASVQTNDEKVKPVVNQNQIKIN